MHEERLVQLFLSSYSAEDIDKAMSSFFEFIYPNKKN